MFSQLWFSEMVENLQPRSMFRQQQIRCCPPPLLSLHLFRQSLCHELPDTLQKHIVLFVLAIWSRINARRSLEWSITLFSISTLPNALVMGIPLLKGMYDNFSGSLMVQIVVLQCIIWYTLMLILFEYRGARTLINEQFPDTAGSIVSFRVDSDVLSLAGKEPLETEADFQTLKLSYLDSTAAASLIWP